VVSPAILYNWFSTHVDERSEAQMNGNPTDSRRRPGREWATTEPRAGGAALLCVAVLVLAGCGGSKAPSVAELATTTSSSAATTHNGTGSTNATGGAAASGSSSSQTPQQEALAYAQCMRANGVPNFPDPTAGGGFLFSSSAVDRSSPAFIAAQAKCKRLLPGGGLPGPGTSTHPTTEALAEMVKIAACMRRHGVSDFPDPQTSVPSNPFPAGSAGVISDIDGVILVFPESLDTQSPLFTKAAATCQFPLHNH
jgi:hypothetical protein